MATELHTKEAELNKWLWGSCLPCDGEIQTGDQPLLVVDAQDQSQSSGKLLKEVTANLEKPERELARTTERWKEPTLASEEAKHRGEGQSP